MPATVNDVKDIARKVWPEATEFSVYITAANGETPKRYHISVLKEHQTLLGRITAEDLNGLREQLERRRSRVA